MGQQKAPRIARAGQQRRFLRALADSLSVEHACQVAGVGRMSVYRWRAKDPKFAKRWEMALDHCHAALERSIYDRAVNGWDEPVYHKGVMVGTKRVYSPVLMIFAAKAKLGWKDDGSQLGGDAMAAAAQALATALQAARTSVPDPPAADESAAQA